MAAADIAQTLTLTTRLGNVITQFSFLVPKDKNRRQFLFGKISNCKDNEARLNQAFKWGMKLHNVIDDNKVELPGKMEFVVVDGRMQLSRATSYDEGQFLPYRGNPYKICAFTFGADKKNNTPLLETVGLAEKWQKAKDMTYIKPSQDVCEFFLTDNNDVMTVLKNVKPIQQGYYFPAMTG